ncbi:unannotated protein [freshwater metagenome]|uniref:Unannotated protein n=1 Tax=freshwater metagenome TaxID=449393 RepID=A0A6J7Q8R1_9ZZZZ
MRDHRLDAVGLVDGRVRGTEERHRVEALEDVVVGHEVDGIGRVPRLGHLAEEEARQVATHQASHLRVSLGQLAAQLRLVEAGEAQHRGQQVGVAGEDVGLLVPTEQLGVVEDHGHAHGLVVRVVPLLEHATVRAEHLAVVRHVDHDRVAVHALVSGERADHAGDVLVDLLLQLVVEAVVGERVVVRLEAEGVLAHEAGLGRGLGAQVLGVRLVVHRGEQIVRHVRALQLLGEVERARRAGQVSGHREVAPQGDVVWVHERRHQQPRLGRLAQALELLDIPVGEHGVAAHAVGARRAGVEGVTSVRLRTDEAGEAVLLEDSGLHVDALEVRVGHAGAGVRRHRVVRAGLKEVDFGDVPLALPQGFVAGRAEPVAQRGHRPWLQPVEVRLHSGLCRPRGLRHPVQRGVLAGVHRRARGLAGDRHRVVLGELHRVAPQEILRRQVDSAPGLELLALVHGRRALLVHHDDQEVGPAAKTSARAERRGHGSSRGASGGSGGTGRGHASGPRSGEELAAAQPAR